MAQQVFSLVLAERYPGGTAMGIGMVVLGLLLVAGAWLYSRRRDKP